MVALSHISLLFAIFTIGLGISLTKPTKEDFGGLNYTSNHMFRDSDPMDFCNLAEFSDKREKESANPDFRMEKFGISFNDTDNFWQNFERLVNMELARGCIQKNLKTSCSSKTRPKHLRTLDQRNGTKLKILTQKLNSLKKEKFEGVPEKQRSLQDSETDTVTDTDTMEESGEISL